MTAWYDNYTNDVNISDHFGGERRYRHVDVGLSGY